MGWKRGHAYMCIFRHGRRSWRRAALALGGVKRPLWQEEKKEDKGEKEMFLRQLLTWRSTHVNNNNTAQHSNACVKTICVQKHWVLCLSNDSRGSSLSLSVLTSNVTFPHLLISLGPSFFISHNEWRGDYVCWVIWFMYLAQLYLTQRVFNKN